jgi:hypothetical protein
MLRVTHWVPAQPGALEALLEGLVRQNEWQHAQLARHGKRLVPLYTSRVVYRRDPPGVEWFRSAVRVYREGWGDCDDLSAARAAELRFHHGEPARAVVVTTKTPGLLHAVVLRADGTIDDPSLQLLRRHRGRR